MTRPMPSDERYQLWMQFPYGRRLQIAKMMSDYLTTLYMTFPAWDLWTRSTCQDIISEQAATRNEPESQRFDLRCLCEEEWAVEILWRFVSNDAEQQERQTSMQACMEQLAVLETKYTQLADTPLSRSAQEPTP